MEDDGMERIAVIAGPVNIYWSSVIRVFAVAAAICCFLALYLKKEKPFVAVVFLPAAGMTSLVFARLAHWYFRPDSYESLYAAMQLFAPGDFALMGVFAGCFLAALVARIVRLTDNLPELLDCLCISGSLGIAAGRLASFFNTSGRGMIIWNDVGLPWVSAVINPVSGLEEYRLDTFLLQSLAAGMIFIILLIFCETAEKCGTLKDGDVSLVFLLCYGASQVILDSTRYDSLYFHSNGFVSVVQVLGAVSVVLPMMVFGARLIYAEGFQIRQLALWVPQVLCFGLAGYMEYYVQRHGNQALYAYSVMTGALLVLILLSLLTRRLAMMAEDRRRQQILQMAEQKGCVSWKGWK